jgi:hypothetical protein
MSHEDLPASDRQPESAPDPAAPETRADAPGPPPGGGAQIREVLSNVGTQLERLRRLQEEQDRQAIALDERLRAMVAREREISERERRAQRLMATAEDRTRQLAQNAAANEHRSQSIARERDALERRQDEATSGQVDARKRYEAELALVEAEREAIARERAHLAERERALAEAPPPAAGSGDNAAEALGALREKTRRLGDVARHLKRRRDRLQRLKVFLKEQRRSAPAAPIAPAPSAAPAADSRHSMLEQHIAQMRKLEQKRLELKQAADVLSVKERRMLKRWAAQRAVATIGWLVVIAIATAGGALWAAHRWFPPTLSASVRLEAKSANRGGLTPEETASWQRWHVELIGSDVFRGALADRFLERKIEAYADAEALGHRLTSELAIDTTEPEAIVLTLAGHDGTEISQFLDVLATSIAAESTRQLRSRNGAAWAVVGGERESGGRLAYSTLNPGAVGDDRLMWAGIFFGPGYALLLVLVALTYGRLVKAKREFDSDGSLFLDTGSAGGTAKSGR